MFTVFESRLFTKLWPDYWTEEERSDFAAYLAKEPDAGAVVPGGGGVRKVRWSRHGGGKRGGVRIIYFNRLRYGQIWLLTIYAKSRQESAPAHILRQLKEEIENALE